MTFLMDKNRIMKNCLEFIERQIYLCYQITIAVK